MHIATLCKHFGILSSLTEKAMAPHSSTLAWKIPWMEEPGGLQSTGSLRVRHDWATSLSLFTFMHWRRKWQPTPVFLPENPRNGGAWWAAVYGVAQSWTRLKWLSSSKLSNLPLRGVTAYLKLTAFMKDLYSTQSATVATPEHRPLHVLLMLVYVE